MTYDDQVSDVHGQGSCHWQPQSAWCDEVVSLRLTWKLQTFSRISVKLLSAVPVSGSEEGSFQELTGKPWWTLSVPRVCLRLALRFRSTDLVPDRQGDSLLQQHREVPKGMVDNREGRGMWAVLAGVQSHCWEDEGDIWRPSTCAFLHFISTQLPLTEPVRWPQPAVSGASSQWLQMMLGGTASWVKSDLNK